MMPCAGKSSRFPNMRPKWSLTHPTGRLMIAQSIMGLNLDQFDSIVMVATKFDIEKYNMRSGLVNAFSEFDVDFILYELDSPTKSQSETVSTAINALNLDGKIFVKDCDAYFSAESIPPDSVCVYSLQDVESIVAKSKSYVDVDNYGYIKTIVEKKVIGELFCCGGYSFSESKEFVDTFNKVSRQLDVGEIYVSHIIHQQLLDGCQFKINPTKDFLDWGTVSDWNEYKDQYKTIFTDLDGVLVKNSGQYFEPIWGSTEAIQKNVDWINHMHDSGTCRVIITTSRKSSFRKETLDQLSGLGIKYHDIIFDLPHGERILINDYAPTNSNPAARSVNIKRNSEELGDLI